jgi:hypothetical protein
MRTTLKYLFVFINISYLPLHPKKKNEFNGFKLTCVQNAYDSHVHFEYTRQFNIPILKEFLPTQFGGKLSQIEKIQPHKFHQFP